MPSKDFIRLNPHVRVTDGGGLGLIEQAQRPAPRIPRVGASGEMPPGPKREADLQAACERILEEAGYVRLTAKNAERCAGHEYLRGWFGHIARAPGNPLFPDLVVFNSRQWALHVELKRRKKYGRGQREMIDAGWWTEVNTEDQFRKVLEAWERGA